MQLFEHERGIRLILRLVSPRAYLFRGRVVGSIEAFLMFASVEMGKNVS
jgi:hypothetical protein